MQKYGWDPQEYEKHSAAQQLWARELIAKLALQGDEAVLDIGCGDGKVSAEIAALVPRGSVLGVDNSAPMIRHAIERFPPAAFPNLRFRREDASSLPFEGEFDVVFSNAALHWVRDHRPVLHGITRSLRPGGRILLQMGGAGNAAGVLAVLDDLTCEPEWREYFEGAGCPYGFHAPDEYRCWLRDARLTPVRVDLIPKDMTHPGEEGLAGWLRTTWLPYTQRVPEERREEFVVDLVRRYVRRFPPDAEGRVHVEMVRLEVEARREHPDPAGASST
jgi:trans-aconitate 2-methyltransferase